MVWKRGTLGLRLNILYNWDSNRLSIIASATFNQPRLFEASSTFNLRLKSDDDFRKIQREACRELIGSMREKLALNGDTGEPNTADGSILFLRFTHTTFTSNDRPENLRKELDNITTLRASFGETKCQSSVSSPKILFEE
jgi:hypothetical protein